MSHAAASATIRPDAAAWTTWRGAVLALFLGGLYSTVGLFSAGIVVWSFVREIRLRTEGVITTAVVVTRRESADGDGGTDHSLSLAYKAPSGPGQPARSFVSEVDVSAMVYRDLPRGSAVPLRYVRTDPAMSWLAQEPFADSLFRIFGTFIVCVFAWSCVLLGLLFIFCWLVCCYTLIPLALFGRRIPGRVVERWVQTDHGQTPEYCLSYRFQPPNGPAQLAAEINARAYRRLEAGSEVQVVFLPRRPEVCRLVLR